MSVSPVVLIAAASNNLTLLKNGPGQVRGVFAGSIEATVPFWLKFVNKKATADVTVGTTAVVAALLIPANSAGAGFAYNVPEDGWYFDTGICVYTVTGAAANDTGTTGIGANDFSITFSIN